MVWYSHLLKNFPQFVVIQTVKGFSVVNGAEVDVFLSIDHKAPKAWKCTSWSFTGKLCPPCPRALLFQARPVDQQHRLAWEVIRTRNLVSNPDPLTQNLQIPGGFCSHYSLRSAGLEALLYHPVVAPSPRCRQPERTRGCGHLEPLPL